MDGRVVGRLEPVEVERPVTTAAAERPAVTRLLAAEPDPSSSSSVSARNRSGVSGSAASAKPVESGLRR